MQTLYMWEFVNPFPHIDTFWHLCSRKFFENMATKEETSNFFFCHHVFNYCSFILRGFSVLLPRCFQSLLHKICCLWERVTLSFSLLRIHFDTCETDMFWKQGRKRTIAQCFQNMHWGKMKYYLVLRRDISLINYTIYHMQVASGVDIFW